MGKGTQVPFSGYAWTCGKRGKCFECRAGALEEIVVRPDCRGLGIGKAPLAEFEKWAVACGAGYPFQG